MPRLPRRLAVIVSLDVAGYTRLIQTDERGTLAELSRIRRRLVEPTLAAAGGNLFKTMGDGALIEFMSVEDAVGWTVDFQHAMAARNGEPGARPIAVRAAIALADVLVSGSDRFGAAVGFVVRLQSVAPPGGIAITHSVRSQLMPEQAALFVRPEMHTLKGIAEPVEMWTWKPGAEGESSRFAARAVDADALGDAPVGPPSDVRAPPPAERPEPLGQAVGPPAIVVLPFDNLTGDPAAETLVDGVVEEITATLSRVRDFTVIARNSAYAYRGRAVDVRELSRSLGVDYVLEGSLRQSGSRVRITAQLVAATTGAHLWADRYDGVVEDIFDLQDHIAERVAGAIQPSIRAAEIEHVRRRRPDSLAAYGLVMRALPHLWAHRRDDNAEAIRLLDEALAVDPGYARAAAFAAWAHAQQVAYNWSVDLDAERAAGDRLIARASDGVADDPSALTALASATMLLFADLDRAEAFVERALAIDTNHAWAWTRRGFLDVYRGNGAAAAASFERSIRLSPLDPFSFNSYIGLGLAAFAAGRPGDAAGWTRRALREKPGMTWPYRDAATFLAHAGDLPGARRALAAFLASRPGVTLATVADALHFMAPDLLARYLDGLRRAGLADRPASADDD